VDCFPPSLVSSRLLLFALWMSLWGGRASLPLVVLLAPGHLFLFNRHHLAWLILRSQVRCASRCLQMPLFLPIGIHGIWGFAPAAIQRGPSRSETFPVPFSLGHLRSSPPLPGTVCKPPSPPPISSHRPSPFFSIFSCLQRPSFCAVTLPFACDCEVVGSVFFPPLQIFGPGLPLLPLF